MKRRTARAVNLIGHDVPSHVQADSGRHAYLQHVSGVRKILPNLLLSFSHWLQIEQVGREEFMQGLAQGLASSHVLSQAGR
jgi:hypothetical protein